MGTLPPELIETIMAYARASAVVALGMTCTSFAQTARGERVWRALYGRDFGPPDPLPLEHADLYAFGRDMRWLYAVAAAKAHHDTHGAAAHRLRSMRRALTSASQRALCWHTAPDGLSYHAGEFAVQSDDQAGTLKLVPDGYGALVCMPPPKTEPPPSLPPPHWAYTSMGSDVAPHAFVEGNWVMGIFQGRGRVMIESDVLGTCESFDPWNPQSGPPVLSIMNATGRSLFIASGQDYYGQHRTGQRSGYGRYTWEEQDYTACEWNEGKRHGRCMENAPSPGSGQYVNSVRRGYGVKRTSEGRLIESSWSPKKNASQWTITRRGHPTDCGSGGDPCALPRTVYFSIATATMVSVVTESGHTAFLYYGKSPHMRLVCSRMLPEMCVSSLRAPVLWDNALASHTTYGACSVGTPDAPILFRWADALACVRIAGRVLYAPPVLYSPEMGQRGIDDECDSAVAQRNVTRFVSRFYPIDWRDAIVDEVDRDASLAVLRRCALEAPYLRTITSDRDAHLKSLWPKHDQRSRTSKQIERLVALTGMCQDAVERAHSDCDPSPASLTATECAAPNVIHSVQDVCVAQSLQGNEGDGGSDIKRRGPHAKRARVDDVDRGAHACANGQSKASGDLLLPAVPDVLDRALPETIGRGHPFGRPIAGRYVRCLLAGRLVPIDRCYFASSGRLYTRTLLEMWHTMDAPHAMHDPETGDPLPIPGLALPWRSWMATVPSHVVVWAVGEGIRRTCDRIQMRERSAGSAVPSTAIDPLSTQTHVDVHVLEDIVRHLAMASPGCDDPLSDAGTILERALGMESQGKRLSGARDPVATLVRDLDRLRSSCAEFRHPEWDPRGPWCLGKPTLEQQRKWFFHDETLGDHEWGTLAHRMAITMPDARYDADTDCVSLPTLPPPPPTALQYRDSHGVIYADLGEASLVGASLTDVFFMGQSFDGATFAGARLTRCVFIGCTFHDTVFAEALLVSCGMYDCRAEGAPITMQAAKHRIGDLGTL